MRVISKCSGFVLTATIACSAFAQHPDAARTFVFLPGRLAVPPLVASAQEPHVGLRKEIGSSKMKLDIGASVDFLEVRTTSDSSSRFRVGIDFFTYALSTSADGLRLQIDAVDGFFGGHVAYIDHINAENRFVVRLRLLHLSAHFLDGHFNNSTQTWKGNRPPVPFTRDFGELIGMYDATFRAINLKVYGGFSYATLIRPVEIGRVEWHAGFELHSDKVIRSVFDKPFNIYLAEHTGLRTISSTIGTSNLEFGVKFGDWTGTGLRIYGDYFSGLDVFSQYYDIRRSNWGIGFAFDFW